jgi:hypothetical protein
MATNDLMRKQLTKTRSSRPLKRRVMAHCCWCHANFNNSRVKSTKDGADICPECKTQNFTIVLDGHAHCGCENECEP